ncbi:hypothetical protein JXB41_04025 [Candidatus Woesearchaeota archaeon]|nr:hypothetical protein [Candidatus Woesearchaeota archaeon]
MSSANYYGRIDYTCPKTNKKDFFILASEFFVSFIDLIKAIFGNLNYKLKIWLKNK